MRPVLISRMDVPQSLSSLTQTETEQKGSRDYRNSLTHWNTFINVSFAINVS